jgi:hypothetical protein
VFQGNINGASLNKIKQSTSLRLPGNYCLNINKTDLGDLKFDDRDQNLEKFTINSFLENENFESFNAGNFQIIDKRR